jgi:hypothetical protein
MTVIIGQSNAPRATYVQRKIRCPGHYLVPANEDIYLRRPVKALKDCSDHVEYLGKKIRIKKTTIVTDAWGNKQIDWRKFNRLRREGKILQPEISAQFAIEHIWDPKGQLCRLCDKRCRRGQGVINELGIKRLNG